MQAIKECTHGIMVSSDQHAYDKDASDHDEIDDEAPATVPAFLLLLKK